MVVLSSVNPVQNFLVLLAQSGGIEFQPHASMAQLANRLVHWNEERALGEPAFDELGDWLVEDSAVAEVFASKADLANAIGRTVAQFLPPDLTASAQERPMFAAMVDAAAALFLWYTDRLKLAAPGMGDALVILGASPVVYGFDARNGIDVLADTEGLTESCSVDLDPPHSAQRESWR